MSSSNGWDEFDRWCDARNIPVEETAQAFAQWMAELSGGTIIGRQVNGDDLVIATPDDLCGYCSGNGWTAEPDERGEPMQVQCSYCYGTGWIQLDEEGTDR
jgi:hypothetical protein